MSSFAIQVKGLSKRYRLGVLGYGSLQQDLASFWARLRGKEDPNSPLYQTTAREQSGIFWALRELDFDVAEGEVLGIIGRNGAGKSTLLKILANITAPSAGEIALRGRLASLLEVGTGFHPELTGRENVFINGAILGMTKREISKKFDEIVDFSGVETFIDTPVKRYSSGMYVRLAFAVAAHLEAEILLVDEVLAVGDAEFQKKCLGKMGQVAESGRTVLFVSHQMTAVSNLCGKVLVLDEGRRAFWGETREGLIHYRKSLAPQSAALPLDPQVPVAADKIRNCRLFTSQPNNFQEWGEALRIEFDITLEDPAGIELDAIIYDENLNKICVQLYYDYANAIAQNGAYHIECTIPKVRLYSGKYLVSLLVQSRQSKRIIDGLEYVLGFEVVMDNCKLKPTPWLPDSLSYIEDSQWVVSKHQ